MKKKFIISYIYLFVSILFFGYIFYKSEIISQSANYQYYVQYYILSLVLILISIISFYISKKNRVNSFIFFITCLSSLYIIEFGLIKYKYIKKIKIKTNFLNQYDNNTFDKRSKIEVYKDLLVNDINASLYVSPSNHLSDKNLEILPLSGMSKSNTILCNEGGFYSKYISDRHGFNNPDTEWEKKQIDYLLVGDSFVHGACVDRPNDIASLLRGDNEKSFIKKNNVINLGQSATGPLIQYATLREYLGSKKVKNILWFFFENDIRLDLYNEINIPALKKYLNDSTYTQSLKEKQLTINSIIKKKIVRSEISKNFNWMLFLKLSSVRSLTPLKKKMVSNQILNNFYDIIRLSNNLAKKNNSNFFFIYLPGYEFYSEPNKFTQMQYHEKIIKKIKSLDITVIDMHENVFSKHADTLSLFPFRRNGHYNELGYRLITENIYRNINK
jgi:hypothetical protein